MNKEFDEIEMRRVLRKKNKEKLERLKREQEERGDPKEQYLSWVMQKEKLMMKKEMNLLKKAKTQKSFK